VKGIVMADKIKDGELAVRVINDINGGAGSFVAGEVVRDMQENLFNTFVQAFGAEVLEPGMDFSKAPKPAPAAPTA